MMSKTKVTVLLLLLFAILCFLELYVEKMHDEYQLEFHNGFENQIVMDLYKNDINDVYQMTESKQILIDYATFDLNDNGLSDFIVFIRSPLHSGAHGDLLNILLNKGDGFYKTITSLSIQVFDQISPKKPIVFIATDKTDGFNNIIIQRYQSTLILVYSDGRYIVQNQKSNLIVSE